MYNPHDHYFKKAKKEWYKARSAFKLDEIQNKFHIFNRNTKSVIDIGCSPGSWLQYAVVALKREKVKRYKIVWFDIKESEVNLEWVETFVQDITETEKVEEVLTNQWFLPGKVDTIISDMAPNTIWLKDIDAIRSFDLLTQTLRIYKKYLKTDWKFAIKVFMGPWFEEFVSDMKKIFGWKSIKVFKPNACRRESKETYVVKYR